MSFSPNRLVLAVVAAVALLVLVAVAALVLRGIGAPTADVPPPSPVQHELPSLPPVPDVSEQPAEFALDGMLASGVRVFAASSSVGDETIDYTVVVAPPMVTFFTFARGDAEYSDIYVEAGQVYVPARSGDFEMDGQWWATDDVDALPSSVVPDWPLLVGDLMMAAELSDSELIEYNGLRAVRLELTVPADQVERFIPAWGANEAAMDVIVQQSTGLPLELTVTLEVDGEEHVHSLRSIELYAPMSGASFNALGCHDVSGEPVSDWPLESNASDDVTELRLQTWCWSAEGMPPR